MTSRNVTVTVFEGQDVVIASRVTNLNGVLLSPNNVTADINLEIFDLSSDTPGTSVAQIPIPVVPASPPIEADDFQSGIAGTGAASALLDDGYWEKDTIGYNFRHILSGLSVFTDGNRQYQLEYTFKTADSGEIPIVAIVSVLPLYSK